MQKVKLVIFDLDGTLFRTETVDVEAFNKALALNGFQMKSSEQILSLMGLVLEDVCKELTNISDCVTIEKFKNDVIKFEKEAIMAHGELYIGVSEFLSNLTEKGYTLCICSNGNSEYVKAISEKFKFNNIFSEILYETKGFSKAQAVKILKDKYQADSFIMIGDRLCDIEAAKINGGISIGAAYGFGKEEADTADYTAYSIPEVEKIILSIAENNKGL
ncbi:MAG: HAD family hydrolase [Ruminiclostridium sp.]